MKSTMITFAKMWIPSIVNIISIHCHDDWRDGIGEICVYLCKTWNPISLTMEVKESQTTLCVVMHYLPWTQRSRCIPIGSMAWPHMHWKKPWAVGWGRPNLVCNYEEKMLKTILKNKWLGGQKAKHLNVRLHKISAKCNDN
jgi:hypothetical protein